jgi:outer membrane protein assembly factor BamB
MSGPLPTVRALLLLALLCAGCRSGPGMGSRPPAGAQGKASVSGGGNGGAPGIAWHWEAPTPASVGMPAADDRDVAFTYGHQHLVVLDADGRARWDAARLGLRDVAPRFTADLVLAATDDGLAAFRRSDGGVVWDTALQGRANTPVVAAGLAVTSTWEGDLVGVDLVAGKVAWRIALGGSAIGPPAGDGTTVVATWEEEHRQGGGAVAVDAPTGRRRWAAPLPPGGIGGPAVTPDGTVVVVAGDVAAHGLVLGTGQERWRTPLEGAGSPEVPPVAVGPDKVLTAHRLGGLDLLDTATGQRTWQVRTDGAAVRGGPVVGPGGTFAFPLDDGRMLLAGPQRDVELRQAPSRISGLAAGPGGLLLAATRGGTVNSIQATPRW